MSGGVDSAVAAALLVEQGHDVVGLTMDLWPSWLPEPEGNKQACCGLTAIEDARTAARRLGIRHYVLNLREEFEREVIDYFCEEYARGRTPNPCIACNQAVKFRILLGRAEALGCGVLATGHYARIATDDASGRWLLLRAADRRKDQSYLLYTLTQEQLARIRLPVGSLFKEEVRSLARRRDLPVANKPDSQEICFVPSGRYGDMVAARRPETLSPGPIRDRVGAVLGTHTGIARYTVGQRRGLGLSLGVPRYVLEVDARRNMLVVGGQEDLLRRCLGLSRVNWIVPTPLPAAVTVRARHASPDVPAVLHDDGPDRVRVEFCEPQRAAAPGQAVAFYDGDRVLGGGTIEDACWSGEEMNGNGKPQ
ncbi:MAG: tRNA 2-thiouridine(34) synthase MnmA [Armatimonadetes bacterium]|nr:tRNA 2-thiouridine(34) synthase MnmA [Armatimonadota bacterium]